MADLFSPSSFLILASFVSATCEFLACTKALLPEFLKTIYSNMKVSSILVAALAAVTQAKNVVNLASLEEAISKEQESRDLHKREPKHVIDLAVLSDSVTSLSERHQGRSVDLDSFFDALENKKDIREVSQTDLDASLVSSIEKRTPKNIISLEAMAEILKEELGHEKRSFESVGRQFFLQMLGINDNEDSPVDKSKANLDVLHSSMSTDRDISIFAAYVRDEANVAAAIEEDKVLVVVASTDDAISNKLNGLKPWEFPLPIVGSEDDEANVEANLSNFVLLNIISLNSEEIKRAFLENSESQVEVTSFNGKKYTLSNRNGADFVNNIKVEKTMEFDDGLILVIDDCLVKPE